MSTIYDPTNPEYLDEAGVRAELTRAFDICNGCRRCTELCTVFPTLFDMLERRDPPADAGLLTPGDQDHVADGCVQCALCTLGCPYAPGRDEAELDLARLLLRHRAVRHETGQLPIRRRVTAAWLGRVDLVGRIAIRAPWLAAGVTSAAPGSRVRRLVAALLGVSSSRLLAPFTRQRFSTWFRERPRARMTRPRAHVTLVPTCLVEYQVPGVGRDLVKVYERNGIECSISAIGCCGAPALHAGATGRFLAIARENVTVLAREVRRGTDVVVAQPTCSHALRCDYPAHVPGADAALVAAHTFDAAEYLMRIHRGEGTQLDTEFPGDVPRTITYHAACLLRAQDVGLKSRDLLRLTGARVRVVRQCAGIESLWGLRAGDEDRAWPLARRLGAMVTAAGGDVVAGDCQLANTVITEETGRVPVHPMQIIARAYGIAEEHIDGRS